MPFLHELLTESMTVVMDDLSLQIDNFVISVVTNTTKERFTDLGDVGMETVKL